MSHGGMTKVGRVKARTPHVAKTATKKKKTGRARKRQLYNRRFHTLRPRRFEKFGPNQLTPADRADRGDAQTG